MQTLLCPAIEVGGGQRWTVKRSNECCLTIQDALPASFDLFLFLGRIVLLAKRKRERGARLEFMLWRLKMSLFKNGVCVCVYKYCVYWVCTCVYMYILNICLHT